MTFSSILFLCLVGVGIELHFAGGGSLWAGLYAHALLSWKGGGPD